MKKEFPEFHFLRLAATMAVVLLHTSSGIYGNWENYADATTPDKHIFALIIYLTDWSVPMFLMISGALLLAPEKRTDYKTLVEKYVKRIFLALLIFALPMALSESFLQHRDEGMLLALGEGCLNWLCGHSWAHTWYLYMIMGIYMVIPVIKPFMNATSDREVETGLGVLFTLSILMPALVSAGIPLEGYMIMSPTYIFIFMLGYYLHTRAEKHKFFKSKLLWVVVLVASIAFVATEIFSKGVVKGCGEIAYLPITIAIFMLAKASRMNWEVAKKASGYCFGVFLIHPLFINISYKILNITPLNLFDANPAIAILLLFCCFLGLSFAGAYIMSKVPFIKKYIL